MSVVKKEIEIAQGIDNCMVLIVNLAKAIKDKKSPAEIVGSELQDLINAMSSLNQIGDEAKDKKAALETVLLGLSDLAAVFIG